MNLASMYGAMLVGSAIAVLPYSVQEKFPELVSSVHDQTYLLADIFQHPVSSVTCIASAFAVGMSIGKIGLHNSKNYSRNQKNRFNKIFLGTTAFIAAGVLGAAQLYHSYGHDKLPITNPEPSSTYNIESRLD